MTGKTAERTAIDAGMKGTRQWTMAHSCTTQPLGSLYLSCWPTRLGAGTFATCRSDVGTSGEHGAVESGRALFGKGRMRGIRLGPAPEEVELRLAPAIQLEDHADPLRRLFPGSEVAVARRPMEPGIVTRPAWGGEQSQSTSMARETSRCKSYQCITGSGAISQRPCVH